MQLVHSQNGVSEVVGYILILGIMITSIGLMYTYGFPVLESSQSKIRYQSVEQGFAVLQSNLDKTAYDQAPVKTTRINVGEGTLSTSSGDHLKLAVNVTNATKFQIELDLGVIEYEYGEDSVAYMNGGVFEKQAEYAFIKFPPTIFVYEDLRNNETIAMISLIKMESNISSGSGIVTVVSKYNGSDTHVFIESGGNVILEINSSKYADAWEDYFIKMKGSLQNTVIQLERSGDELAITIPFNKVIITENKLKLEIT
ncbi:MAG: hypothetical protein QXL78_03790 [Methanocellales archaeon]